MYSPGCKDGAPARPLYHALAARTRTLSRASSTLIIGNSCVALLPVTKTPPCHPACREMPIRTAVPATASWSGRRTPRQDVKVGTKCSERCACAYRPPRGRREDSLPGIFDALWFNSIGALCPEPLGQRASAGDAIDFHPAAVIQDHRGNARDAEFAGGPGIGSAAVCQVHLDPHIVLS